jgi:hypothetical protein
MWYQKDPVGAFGPVPEVGGTGFAGTSMSIAKPGGGVSGMALLYSGPGRLGVASEPVQPARPTTIGMRQRSKPLGTHPIRRAGAVLTCGRMYLRATVLR